MMNDYFIASDADEYRRYCTKNNILPLRTRLLSTPYHLEKLNPQADRIVLLPGYRESHLTDFPQYTNFVQLGGSVIMQGELI